MRKMFLLKAAAIGMLGALGTAQAAIVNLSFHGLVDGNYQEEASFFSRARLVDGDILKGSFSYDTEAPNEAAPYNGKTVGKYTLTSFSFSIGDNKLVFRPQDTQKSKLHVINEYFGLPEWDYLGIIANGTLTNPATGELIESQYSGIFTFPQGYGLTSNAPPSIEELNTFFSINDPTSLIWSKLDHSPTESSISFRDYSWSVNENPPLAVPIPGTIWLVGAGLATLAGSRKYPYFLKRSI